MINVDLDLNTVNIPDSVQIVSKKDQIIVIGENNYIEIGNNVKFQDCNIRLKGNNIKLVINDDVQLTGVVASLFQNTELFIGKSTTLGKGEITIAENCNISIGKDCMFAHGYEIINSDMHPIYDLDTGDRINVGSSVTIGDHVWGGRDVVILKGVTISNNIVIGIRSVVSNSILTPNSIVAGVPARVLRKNIIWGRMMYNKTMFDDLTLDQFIK